MSCSCAPCYCSAIIVGLNGALQKRFVLAPKESLIPGNVHRAASLQTGVGGKGQDVAITLSCLLSMKEEKNKDNANNAINADDNINDDGLDDSSLKMMPPVCQFVGMGAEGNLVLELLQQRLGYHAATALSVRTKSPMRTCTTIVAEKESTELVEPSGIITEDERLELMQALKNYATSSALTDTAPEACVGTLCIMGSMPPGLPDDMYAQIYKTVASSETTCVIDSVIGLDALLLQIMTNLDNAANANADADIAGQSLRRGPVLLKINASELCKLAGVTKSNTESGGIVLEELLQAVTAFLSQKPYASKALDGIALTDGKHPAHLISLLKNHHQRSNNAKANANGNDGITTTSSPSFEVYKIPIPSLDTTTSTTLYPIGAGDSVAAGTLASWKTLQFMSKNRNNNNNEKKTSSMLLGNEIQTALQEQMQKSSMSSSQDDDNQDDDDKEQDRTTTASEMVTAFSFGLACGSASCLCEENSVVEVKQVMKLFQSMTIPSQPIYDSHQDDGNHENNNNDTPTSFPSNKAMNDIVAA